MFHVDRNGGSVYNKCTSVKPSLWFERTRKQTNTCILQVVPVKIKLKCAMRLHYITATTQTQTHQCYCN